MEKCKVCGGSGVRLQPTMIGKVMSLMPLPCVSCSGSGKSKK